MDLNSSLLLSQQLSLLILKKQSKLIQNKLWQLNVFIGLFAVKIMLKRYCFPNPFLLEWKSINYASPCLEVHPANGRLVVHNWDLLLLPLHSQSVIHIRKPLLKLDILMHDVGLNMQSRIKKRILFNFVCFRLKSTCKKWKCFK